MRKHDSRPGSALSRRGRFCAAGILTALCLAGGGWACQVPVFRYALERWNPAEYEIRFADGDGALSGPQRRALEKLRAAAGDGDLPLNAVLHSDPALKNGLRVGLQGAKGGELAGPGLEWELTEVAVDALLDSPVRVQLRERLLAGDSAVWLFLRSGDAGRDGVAEKALQDAIREAHLRVRLPEGAVAAVPGETSASRELLEKVPLHVAFSMLAVDRTDPRERALVKMLAGVEPGLEKFEGEPMAFAVFGRGRVLEPLIGAGIRLENFLEQAAYLCGACSCEIKEQNPGLDLLLRAQWNPVDTTPKVEVVRMVPSAAAAGAGPAISVAAVGQPSRWPAWGAGLAAGAVVLFLLRRSFKS